MVFGSEQDTNTVLKELRWRMLARVYEEECTREFAIRVGRPGGIELGERFLEEGASELRPTGDLELARKRQKREFQTYEAERAKEEKTKHTVF